MLSNRPYRKLLLLGVLALLVSAVSAPTALAAWQDPASSPPACDPAVDGPGCEPPLNVSNVEQEKTGSLGVGDIATGHLIVGGTTTISSALFDFLWGVTNFPNNNLRGLFVNGLGYFKNVIYGENGAQIIGGSAVYPDLASVSLLATPPVLFGIYGKVGASEYCDLNGQNCATPPLGGGGGQWTTSGNNIFNANPGIVGIGGSNDPALALEIGFGVASKGTDAGKIAYEAFPAPAGSLHPAQRALDVVGAGGVGATNRLVRVWDDLDIKSGLTVVNSTTTNATTTNLTVSNICTGSGACQSVSNIFNNTTFNEGSWPWASTTPTGPDIYAHSSIAPLNGNVGIGINAPVAKLDVLAPNTNTAAGDFSNPSGVSVKLAQYNFAVKASTTGNGAVAIYGSTLASPGAGTNTISVWGDGGQVAGKFTSNRTGVLTRGTKVALFSTTESEGSGYNPDTEANNLASGATRYAGYFHTDPQRTDSLAAYFGGRIQLGGISTSTDPSGSSAGMIYYNSSSNKFRCFENNGWKDCIGGGGSVIPVAGTANRLSKFLAGGTTLGDSRISDDGTNPVEIIGGALAGGMSVTSGATAVGGTLTTGGDVDIGPGGFAKLTTSGDANIQGNLVVGIPGGYLGSQLSSVSEDNQAPAGYFTTQNKVAEVTLAYLNAGVRASTSENGGAAIVGNATGDNATGIYGFTPATFPTGISIFGNGGKIAGKFESNKTGVSARGNRVGLFSTTESVPDSFLDSIAVAGQPRYAGYFHVDPNPNLDSYAGYFDGRVQVTASTTVGQTPTLTNYQLSSKAANNSTAAGYFTNPDESANVTLGYLNAGVRASSSVDGGAAIVGNATGDNATGIYGFTPATFPTGISIFGNGGKIAGKFASQKTGVFTRGIRVGLYSSTEDVADGVVEDLANGGTKYAGYFHVDQTQQNTSRAAYFDGPIELAPASNVIEGNTAGTLNPVSGTMYFNSTLNKFRCAEGGAWTNCIGGVGGNTIINPSSWPLASSTVDINDVYFKNSTSTTGNVGIGTDNPTQKLEVDYGDILVQGPGSFKPAINPNATLYLGDTNHYIRSVFGSGVRIGTFGFPDAIVLQQGGNHYVGINQPNPTTNLDVGGTVFADGAVIGGNLTTTGDVNIGPGGFAKLTTSGDADIQGNLTVGLPGYVTGAQFSSVSEDNQAPAGLFTTQNRFADVLLAYNGAGVQSRVTGEDVISIYASSPTTTSSNSVSIYGDGGKIAGKFTSNHAGVSTRGNEVALFATTQSEATPNSILNTVLTGSKKYAGYFHVDPDTSLDSYAAYFGGRIQIVDTTEGADKVLTSDASGIASWQTPGASDIRLKKDISPLTKALDKIKQLRGVFFTWKANDKRSAGVIAQEVEPVLPELVIADNEGIKAVNYNGLVSVLIEAVKEQQGQIESQQKQINDLQADIEALKAAIK